MTLLCYCKVLSNREVIEKLAIEKTIQILLYIFEGTRHLKNEVT